MTDLEKKFYNMEKLNEVATSQQEKRTKLNITEAYRQFIVELLDDVSSIQALKFVYTYLQAHIRRTEKEKAILRAQYEDKEQGDTAI